MRILQVITLLLVGVNIIIAAMLYRTAQLPGQDAAGRGMAQGFAGITIAAIVAAALLLALSQWLQASWHAVLALIVVLLPPRCHRAAGSAVSDAVARFAASLNIDYEKWHDGIGYDLDAIRRAPPAEHSQIEAIMLNRAVEDWRELEALEALATPKATAAIRATLKSSSPELRLRAARALAHEPEGEATREAAIVHAIEKSDVFTGLTQALDAAAQHPTPPVKDALFRCCLKGSSVAAVHAAALLFYLHGLAKEPFDTAQRPFFLKFATEVKADRIAPFKELCARLGVEPGKYLV